MFLKNRLLQSLKCSLKLKNNNKWSYPCKLLAFSNDRVFKKICSQQENKN